MRVLSLLSSSTETIYALGLEHFLVGRSHECDFPAQVNALPACSSPKFPTDGSSYEIDQRIRAIIAEALSVYRVDASKIRSLAPDIIITQVQCEVCAVSLHDVEAALADYLGTRPQILALNPNNLSDCFGDMQRIADILGVSDRGSDLVASLEEKLSLLSASLEHIAMRPTIACIEWIKPLMACGNWIPELAHRAGAIDLLGTPGAHSGVITLEDLQLSDPDVILVVPCGFDLTTTRREMQQLKAEPLWKTLRAVRHSRLYIGDGNQFFNRPGPRLVESAQIIAELAHPDVGPTRFKGVGWEPL